MKDQTVEAKQIRIIEGLQLISEQQSNLASTMRQMIDDIAQKEQETNEIMQKSVKIHEGILQLIGYKSEFFEQMLNEVEMTEEERLQMNDLLSNAKAAYAKSCE